VARLEAILLPVLIRIEIRHVHTQFVELSVSSDSKAQTEAVLMAKLFADVVVDVGILGLEPRIRPVHPSL
jgi:hypothetical protein